MIRWQELSGQGRGVRLHVRKVVEPEAPPVILLHGLGVGGSIWQAFARRLAPHLAAVAPDLRGHGQSDAPEAGYAPSDYALDIAELVEDLKLSTPLAVVGHSLGALVALSLAELRPGLISWLALLDPPLDPVHRNPEVAQVYRLRSAEPGALERYLLERNPGGGQLLAQSLASLFRQASDGAFEALLEPDDATDPLELASRLDAPCLVLQADPEHGGVLGDEAAATVVARLPKASALIKIEGAAHALHASHPAEVAGAILQFGGYVSSVSSSSR